MNDLEQYKYPFNWVRTILTVLAVIMVLVLAVGQVFLCDGLCTRSQIQALPWLK